MDLFSKKAEQCMVSSSTICTIQTQSYEQFYWLSMRFLRSGIRISTIT